MQQQTVTLGGRRFKAVKNSTIEHDYWMMDAIRATGLDALHIKDGESPDQFVRRLLAELQRGGRVFHILGGVLLPAELEGRQWTPEVAEATSAHLRSLTAPEDKAAINVQVLSMLTGFFVTGLASLEISPNYLLKFRGTGGPSDSAEPSISETGTTW